MSPIFYLKDASLSFGDKDVLLNIELYIKPGDRICLVGRNGCGKSSLIKIIEGEYEIDGGELFIDPAVSISYLKQDMEFKQCDTVYNFVTSDLKGGLAENKYQADMILQPLSINGEHSLSSCSGGQLRRAFLAKALISSPDILLLDEPTNHLDITAIEWLEGYVASYQGAVICISHDRAFQENISNKVWWIDRGILRKSENGFKHYDKWRDEVIAAEEAILRKMNRKLEAENSWLHGGVTARRKRNQKRLASLLSLRESYISHQKHLKNAKSKLNIELSKEVKKSQFIIEAESVSYGFANKLLFENFSFKVKKGEKIGVIGPNGVGKSTFIKLLIKKLQPISGKVKHGSNLSITYFDQHRSELNLNLSLRQILCPGGSDYVQLRDKSLHVAAYLKQFMFDPKSINDKVLTLSGGQASRLLLAKALINPGNFFILDEPTNDLDMDSLEMLLEILADYNGTLVIISHDRDFLERLVTRTLVFSDQKIIDLYGGYQDYLEFYKKENNFTDKTKSKPKKKDTDTTKTLGLPSKMSYKYIRMLEVLPNEIEDIEKEIKHIEDSLSKSDLYSRDNEKFLELSSQLVTKNKLLDEKFSLFMELLEMQKSLK